MLQQLYKNNVLTNLVFILVLVVGVLSYMQMPREQDPTINFNWIDISTLAPGMAAEDVEKRVTDILEEGARKVSDIKFVESTSRDSYSNLLVRFNDIDPRTFDKRIADLRREIQNRESDLPDNVESPFIFEVTTANAFPTATIIVSGAANDANLRTQAELVKKDLERIKGVDRILDTALQQPELQVLFNPDRLQALGLSANQVADTVAMQFRDLSAGSTTVGEASWLVRFKRLQAQAKALAEVPLIGSSQDIRLGQAATITPGWEEPRHYVLWRGKPAVMLAVTKQESANTLNLLENLNAYIERSQPQRIASGVEVYLADDQTEITRSALKVMQTNAAIGLLMVLLVVWLFLGFRIAFFTAIGIPFVLAGTFWVLQSMGETLNVMVLLGAVISLGMLVDDAVVVVESISYRLQRGMDAMEACVSGLREVVSPVTTAVLTTMAAFLPLMLLPGIIGKFMRLVPLVVTISLAISLVEAYWILPVHILHSRKDKVGPSRSERFRVRALAKIRHIYARILIKVMRMPIIILLLATAMFAAALFSAVAGQANPSLINNPTINRWLVKTDFFASDTLRLFYVNIQMENGTPLEVTLDKVREVQAIVDQEVTAEERRSVVAYAGQMFTETAPISAAHVGQILVSLQPTEDKLRSVDAIIDALRQPIAQVAGPRKLTFLTLAGGPPTSKAISVKVRGDRFDEIRAAIDSIKGILESAGWAQDVSDNDSPGLNEMVVTVDNVALHRSGLSLAAVLRDLRLLVDGEVVAEVREAGETVYVRVKSAVQQRDNIEDVLNFQMTNANGQAIPLSSVLKTDLGSGFGSIRHYNFRRTIAIEADIDKAVIDTPQANAFIKQEWAKIASQHPKIDLDFTGQLDDLNESLSSIFKLMLFGVLLMYVILGTQFRSYFQPLMILATMPMAFTGVVVGLLVTQNPLSLFTLYGVVALLGIAVNAAIVLISAANDRLQSGMSVTHSTIYAARRRVIPILITSFTTVAGLFSLATGLGGKSLLWGPVATAIVWGLAVSTVLTLFVVPTIYRLVMPFSAAARENRSTDQPV